MSVRMEGIEEWKVREMYEEHNRSMQHIGDYYGVSYETIRQRMINFGIKRKSLSDAMRGNNRGRKYYINEGFFKAWTPESAWLYGWAIGDGGFTNPYLLKFELGRVDREVMEKFKTVLNSEHPIEDYKAWAEKSQRWIYMSAIRFSSKKLVGYLKELSYLDVPEVCFNHFLRGFFEADGSVHKQKDGTRKGSSIHSSITQNDKEILDFIHKKLQNCGIIKTGGVYSHGKGWQLAFPKYDTLSLYHYMYDGCGINIFLKRKKEKFEELIKRETQ